MKIQNYIKAITGIFSKDQLRDNLRAVHRNLHESTLPAYASVSPVLKTWQFKSQEMKDFIRMFNATVERKTSPSVIVNINDLLQAAATNLDIMEKFFESNFAEEIIPGGMTYTKAQVQQFIDQVDFVSTYARKFLNYALISETSSYMSGEESLKDSMLGPDITYVEKNIQAFGLALNSVSVPPGTVPKLLAEIPDYVVTPENLDSLSGTVGERKLDPFGFGFIPVGINPFYLVGMRVAEWQATKFKQAQEDLRVLQLRKLNLEKIAAGKPDVSLKRQIDSLAARADDLTYKLAKMEGK